MEPSIPILMFCIAYGLSMDYEVFIMARIKDVTTAPGTTPGRWPRASSAAPP